MIEKGRETITVHSLRIMEEALTIDKGTIPHEELSKIKVCAKFISRILNCRTRINNVET